MVVARMIVLDHWRTDMLKGVLSRVLIARMLQAQSGKLRYGSCRRRTAWYKKVTGAQICQVSDQCLSVHGEGRYVRLYGQDRTSGQAECVDTEVDWQYADTCDLLRGQPLIYMLDVAGHQGAAKLKAGSLSLLICSRYVAQGRP